MTANLFGWGAALFGLVAPVSIAGSGIVMWCLLGGWLLTLPWTRVWLMVRTPEKIFLGFTLIGIISALHGVDVEHGLRFWSKKDIYFLIVPFLGMALFSDFWRTRFAKAFLIGGLIAAGWGVITFFIGVNQTDCHNGSFITLPTFMTHWPRPILDGLSLVNSRAVGFRCHPLTYAESLLMVLALFLPLVTSIEYRPMFLIFIPGWVLLAALLFSQSRGPWLGAVVMIAFLVLSKPSLKAIGRISLVLLPALFFLFQPALLSRAASIMDQKVTSNSERFHMWHVGWHVWKSYPLLGVGPGNVKRVVGPYETPDELVGGPWGHLHNTFINMLVERGAVGLLLFCSWLLSLGWELFLSMNGESSFLPQRQRWAAMGLLALIGFVVSGFTETVYNDEAVLFAFYAVMGAALSAVRQKNAR